MSLMDKNFEELTFTVFDTETTGMSPAKGARLCEIAAVKIVPGLELDLSSHYETLIDPEVPIPYNVFRIHGISDSMVKGKPKISEALEGFAGFCTDSICAAHNASFDYRFVSHHAENLGVYMPLSKLLCTVKLAKTAYKGLSSYSLDYLLNHFDIDVPLPETYRHRAMYDAAHTAMLMIKCLRQLRRDGIFTLKELYGEGPSAFYSWT